ncbi:transporter substrate-binding domain-containing protein [Hydrogenimonas urashimensis]|uniref:transporter substrate-binding domain-containing protein n=1 Tax=Hydrogenimonas urashimensis TaxID=2740515 RepID=UPI0019161F6C|nr:transporter substrate-binding domain-containing protein [Hydrogenimonas urashimensis]
MKSFFLSLFLWTLVSSPLHSGDTPPRPLFTPEEKAWLQTHPTLRFVYDPDWPPFEWRDELGRYTGMVADVYGLLAQMTGIRFDPIPTQNWAESMDLFRKREAQLISAVTQTPARNAFMDFSHHSLFSLPTVLLRRFDRPSLPKNLAKALESRSVGVVRGYAVEEYLKRTHPRIRLVEFSTVRDGLDQLRSGKIDLFAINSATADYFIHKEGYGDLALAARLPFSIDLHIGFQSNVRPLIRSVLEKALAAIPKSQLRTIYEKWTRPRAYEAKRSGEQNFTLWKVFPLDLLFIVLGLVLVLSLGGWYQYRQRGASVLGIPLLVAALMVFTAALVATAVALHTAKSDRQQEMAESLQTVLNVTHSALREWFFSQHYHLNHVVNRSALLAPFWEKGEFDVTHVDPIPILLGLKSRIVGATGYLVIDRNGTILSASEPSLRGRAITYAPIIREIDRAFKIGFAYVPPVKVEKDRLGHLRHYYIFNVIAHPATHEPVALFAMRLDPLPIFNIVRQGRIGKTGETYLMNTQLQMISRSRFERDLKEAGLLPVNEISFLNIRLLHERQPTLAARDALRNAKGFNVEGYPDYRGIPVLGAWMWDDLLNLAIIVEIDRSEAMASYQRLKTTIFAIVLGIVLLSLALVLFFLFYARSTQKAIHRQRGEIEERIEAFDTLSATIDQTVQERLSAYHDTRPKE